MRKSFWLKASLISLMIGGLAGLSSLGGGCLKDMVQRVLISTAFD